MTKAQTIRVAALRGAAAWAIYGIVETAFIVFGPLLRQVLLPGGNGPAISASLTLVALIVYPLVGALLCGLIVALMGHRVLSAADVPALGSALGSLTVAVALGANAVLTNQKIVAAAAIAPIALAILQLRSAWRPQLRMRRPGLMHPFTVIVMLVGTAFIAQPRAYIAPPLRAVLEIVYIAAIVLLAAIVPTVRRRMQPTWASLVVLSCAALASTFLTASSRLTTNAQPIRRARDPRPNIILITLDTVRADHLSVNGYRLDTTPNLRRLAATCATVYPRAISSSNLTLPTHASIFTGQSPRRHGAHQSTSDPLPRPIASTSATLAEILSERGYRTGGIAANFLSAAFGFDRGFVYYECVSPEDFFARTERPYLLRERVRLATVARISPQRREAAFSNAETINARAAIFLGDAARAPQPFFLFLNYMDAHTPYVPPSPFDARFPGKDPEFRWSSYTDIVDDVSVRHSRSVSDRERRHLVSQYDGSIAYLDDQLQKLFDKLKALDAFDNSLIIVTADHGEAFGESDVVGHGRSVYQHQVHVPLIIKYPRSCKAATDDALVSSVDLLPTIVDIAGAPRPPNIEGTSLLRLERTAPRWITSESYTPRGPGFTSTDTRPTEIALFSGTFKEILGAGGASEIYDLATDPNEETNIYGRVALREESATLLALMNDAGSQSLSQPVTDPEVLKRLRALGYLR
jgi:arylsulfatase A-like enzyme